MKEALIEAIQKEAARILQEDLVDVVIGFRAGTVPLKSRPAFIRHPDAVHHLVYNGLMASNLAAFITRRPRDERIGLICRGCESRAVRALVVEQQRARDALYLIGVPCVGILDTVAVASRAGEDIVSISEADAQIEIRTSQQTFHWPRQEVLHAACRQCRSRQPVGVDILLDGVFEDKTPRETSDGMSAFATLSAKARAAAFAKETDRCIRCYACREACPMCYCTQCFVDHTMPRWTESTVSPAGNQAWHIIRAFHQTGRCVGCGACERACPMDIPMTYLTDQLNMEMSRTYGFAAGEEEKTPPPFTAFTMDDAQRFER